MPIMMFVVNIGIAAGIWMGAIKVNEGLIQVGTILAFINYLNIMMNGLISSSHVLMVIALPFRQPNELSKFWKHLLGLPSQNSQLRRRFSEMSNLKMCISAIAKMENTCLIV